MQKCRRECDPKFNNLFKIKSGGTFLRVFPFEWTLKCLNQSFAKGHIPIVYLHPYEIDLHSEFWIEWKDLKFLKFTNWVKDNVRL